MESMVNDSSVTHVLMVCDSEYQRKADSRDRGVGAETQIVSPSVYADANSKRFVPLVVELDMNGEPCLPTYVSSRLAIYFTNPGEYERRYKELVRHIYDQPEHEPPELGQRPAWLDRKSEPATTTSYAAQGIEHQLHQGRDGPALALLRSFRLDFERSWDPESLDRVESDEPLDEKILARAVRMLKYRDDLVSVVEVLAAHDAQESASEQRFGELHRLLCGLSEAIYRDLDDEAVSFFAHECFVGIMAVLLIHERLDRVEVLLSSPYPGLHGTEGFTVFSRYRRTLDEQRGQRLNSRMFSEEPKIIRDTTAAERWISVVQADLVLWLRAQADDKSWLPRACLYCYEQNAPLPLFRQASLIALGEPIRRLLRVETSQQLPRHGHIWLGHSYGDVDATRALNYRAWAD